MSACSFSPQRWLCDNDCCKSLITSGRVRIENTIRSSKLRGDGIHADLEEQLAQNNDYTTICHKSCVSKYTPKVHIKCSISKSNDQLQSSTTTPSLKRACRSTLPIFDFQTHCLFCGKRCQLGPDSRHLERWKRVIRCKTAEQRGKHDFKKNNILDICNH